MQTNNKIQVLPQNVANQIAAGEVVTCPADIVKELTENSIDAGATQIDIVIVDAGKIMVQVVDNGYGIDVNDVTTAFMRHATSKISKVDDLFSLTTNGFRGEALPSIASVSHVTMTTRRPVDEVGTELTVEGGEIGGINTVACPVGTNIKVENLFYNVKARRAFLGTEQQEKSKIIKAFTRIALVCPDVAFTLTFNGKQMFRLDATATRNRIADVFDKEMANELLPVSVETSLGSINGFVGKPESARKKNVQQMMFVNGRYMEHVGFRSAVNAVYERLVPKGEKVPFFLYFTMPTKDIDVNVHPNKIAVKFSQEVAVKQMVYSVVAKAIGNMCFAEEECLQPIAAKAKPVSGCCSNISPSTQKISGLTGCLSYPVLNKVSAMPTFKESVCAPEETTFMDDATFNSLAESIETEQEKNQMISIPTDNVFQFQGTYIVAPVANGLMVIDQERAHERVVYEKYMAQFESNLHPSQTLMYPETVEFSKCDADSLAMIISDLENVGFDFSYLGDCTYSINAVPAGLENTDFKRIVKELVDAALASPDKKASQELSSQFALSVARNTAIAHGEYLSHEDIRGLLTDLNRCSNSCYSPVGKPIYRIIPQSQIVNMFCA